MSQYDLVVIGSGPGGYVAAIHAAQGGLKTAIVEKESTERLGGTCLLRGCIPTKAMLNTADLIEKMNHAADFGIAVKDAKIDMDMMHAYKDKVVQKNAGGVKYLMKKNKVDVHLGHGRIDGRGKVSVTDKDGKKTVLNTKNVILATGSACRDMPFAPVDHERILNSDDILQLPDIPKHLVVLGAGAVGSEFASVFLRYGSKVTLIELQDRVLPIEDEEVSAEVAKSFKKQGMTVLTSTKMTELKRVKDTVKLKVEGADGKKEELEASHVLVAIGRKSVLEDVGLNKTKIKLDDRGFVPVNDFMQTTEDWVYAIGDLLNTPWLAHVASKEGIHAVDHILGRNPRPINYGLVPNCTYCTPEVASVGLTEKAAKEKGYDVATGVFPFSAIGKAAILGATDGFVKIVSEKKYDQVLGLHIVGPKATELITEGTVAMQLESTLDELIATIHPHPTLAEAVGEAAHAATGHPLHI
ncbi:dihydrolipoyl dehydrogenase [Microvenator marinus]|uniref:Dihydrolipoyl dehydrogenase n=1 Tax=Microvenator marinus TaxID=2600177 RepID=A0A5B8XVS0_9DELT|nr:dihydrolipoyl dehydrogenase [Microvenator marinus]QED27836.1 dihydrolipoyl dehydrogenase [Microvenator marinus]